MSEERKAGERLLFKALVVLIGIGLAYLLLPEIWDKLSPFIIATPLAAVLQPAIGFLQRKLKLNRGLSSLFPVLLAIALGVGAMVYFLSFLIEQLSELVANSPTIVAELVQLIRTASNGIIEKAVLISPEAEGWVRTAMNNMISQVTELGPQLAAEALSYSVSLATSLPYLIIYISFVSMALYFISKDYPEIRAYLPGGRRHRQDSNATQLTNTTIRNLLAYLRVQATFAIMVLVVSWPFLQFLGHPYAAVTAVAAAILEMVPMIGSGMLYIILGILHLLSGESAWGIQALLLTGGLQLLRRILEPKLMSNTMSISPLESLVGMFVGMRVGGILGLIGGPVAMAVLVSAIQGRLFESMRKDTATVVAYFRRRWAPEPSLATDGKDPQRKKT